MASSSPSSSSKNMEEVKTPPLPGEKPHASAGVNWELLRSPKTPEQLRHSNNLDPRVTARHLPLSPYYGPRRGHAAGSSSNDSKKSQDEKLDSSFSLESKSIHDGVTKSIAESQAQPPVTKIFLYGKLRPDMDEENRVIKHFFANLEIKIEPAYVTGAFLFRHRIEGDARAVLCMPYGKSVATSMHHNAIVMGSLVSCVAEGGAAKQTKFRKVFDDIDRFRGAPFKCSRTVVRTRTINNGTDHRAYFYDFHSVRDPRISEESSIFRNSITFRGGSKNGSSDKSSHNTLADKISDDSTNKSGGVQKNDIIDTQLDAIMSGDWAHPEPKWACFNCTNVNEGSEEICRECNIPKSAGSIPEVTLWDPRVADSARKVCVNPNDLTVSAATEARLVPVAYAYDARMESHEEINSKDPLEVHPERPVRIRSIYEHLRAKGLLGRLHRCNARRATRAELRSCHTEDHVRRILESSEMTPQQSYNWRDVYCCKDTAMCSILSAGTTVALTEMILRGSVRSGVAIVRPPGHHAEPDVCMGFCFFNNVAVATHTAKSMGAKRVLIVDWDVHHGNATQKMFEDDPDVLYVSLHRHPFYPETGTPTFVGRGRGLGKNINIGWDRPGVGDAEYLAAFWNVIMPVATAFAPDLVIISAGFDAAAGDPLGGCNVTPSGYAHMTEMLKTLARGRVLVVLEGGYNLRSLAHSTEACVRSLIGEDPVPPATDATPSMGALKCIARTIKHVSPYWDCLRLSRRMMTMASSPTSPDIKVHSGLDEMSSFDSDVAVSGAGACGVKRQRTWSDPDVDGTLQDNSITPELPAPSSTKSNCCHHGDFPKGLFDEDG